MSKHPPETIDPFEFVAKGRVLEGALPLEVMERLRDQLFDTSGEARFALRFAKEGSIRCVRGWVEAELVLQCQSCLHNLEYKLESEVTIGFVQSIDEANLLPDTFDPAILGDQHSFRVADLIEDEILLAIPTVPRHEVCEAADCLPAGEPIDNKATRKPFAGLTNLFPSKTNQS